MQTDIFKLKERLGKDLVILAHHYQSQDIVDIADYTGDSLELAKKIPELTAQYIVFCGVHFMGETAAILTKKGQKVFMPEPNASCVMAETAPYKLAQKVINFLQEQGKKVVPLTYVNSTASIKALCGQLGGSTCTSANAKKMLAWALEQGDVVLFLPDKNLGFNTGISLGLNQEDISLISLTNLEYLNSLLSKKLLLWPGVCAVHFKYKLKHLAQVRTQKPKVKIVVHPECSPEVVAASDANGSTSFIIRYVEEAPLNSVISIGTEENLVKRLRQKYIGQKEILSLYPTFCSNMAKNNLEKVFQVLTSFPKENLIQVNEEVSLLAKKAIETMLTVCS